MTPREEKMEIARRALRREQEILAYAEEHNVPTEYARGYFAALDAAAAKAAAAEAEFRRERATLEQILREQAASEKEHEVRAAKEQAKREQAAKAAQAARERATFDFWYVPKKDDMLWKRNKPKLINARLQANRIFICFYLVFLRIKLVARALRTVLILFMASCCWIAGPIDSDTMPNGMQRWATVTFMFTIGATYEIWTLLAWLMDKFKRKAIADSSQQAVHVS
jgi:hypothetical protein